MFIATPPWMLLKGKPQKSKKESKDLIINELLEAIKEYKSEWENPVPCYIMKQTHRKKIFSCCEKLMKLK